MSEHLHFVMTAYGVTAGVLIWLCCDSYLRWRRIKADYLRLFARKDKADA